MIQSFSDLCVCLLVAAGSWRLVRPATDVKRRCELLQVSGKRKRVRRVKEKIDREGGCRLPRSIDRRMWGAHLDGLRGEMLPHHQVPSASAMAMSGQVAVLLLLKLFPDWFCLSTGPDSLSARGLVLI